MERIQVNPVVSPEGSEGRVRPRPGQAIRHSVVSSRSGPPRGHAALGALAALCVSRLWRRALWAACAGVCAAWAGAFVAFWLELGENATRSQQTTGPRHREANARGICQQLAIEPPVGALVRGWRDASTESVDGKRTWTPTVTAAFSRSRNGKKMPTCPPRRTLRDGTSGEASGGKRWRTIPMPARGPRRCSRTTTIRITGRRQRRASGSTQVGRLRHRTSYAVRRARRTALIGRARASRSPFAIREL